MKHTSFLVLGALSCGLAVVLGAFGAHALKGTVAPDLLAVYQTGVQYHMAHGLGLLLTAVLIGQLGNHAGLRAAGWLMVIGTLLFSGSLYVLSITGLRWLGAVTPFGGTAFIAAWLSLAIGAWRARQTPP